ncbi:MAG: hypothetical protein ITG02_13050 [Patulibacter sp.]|nr:hypothetical protein [Patulibacter sp.]
MGGSFAFFLLICVLFGVAGGLQGRAKGSSFVLWFMISGAVPLFGYIASIVYPGNRHELRRACTGCGTVLPITDTMCMRCGTDLPFPDEVYLPPGVRPPADGEPTDDGGTATDGASTEPSPYEVAAGASTSRAVDAPDDAA